MVRNVQNCNKYVPILGRFRICSSGTWSDYPCGGMHEPVVDEPAALEEQSALELGAGDGRRRPHNGLSGDVLEHGDMVGTLGLQVGGSVDAQVMAAPVLQVDSGNGGRRHWGWRASAAGMEGDDGGWKAVVMT